MLLKMRQKEAEEFIDAKRKHEQSIDEQTHIRFCAHRYVIKCVSEQRL
jgi:hypothetical protein